MSRSVKSLDEIRESRILFDKNPPAFGYILITVVAVFLIVAVVWSIKTPKVYTIQAQGTVTNDESNYVMCSYTGEILDSNMEEGALVEAGDVLFTIKSTDYDLQQTQLEDNRKSYEEQISQYSLLIKSIKDDTNYFDETKRMTVCTGAFLKPTNHRWNRIRLMCQRIRHMDILMSRYRHSLKLIRVRLMKYIILPYNLPRQRLKRRICKLHQ